jgi:hypothetical protein
VTIPHTVDLLNYKIRVRKDVGVSFIIVLFKPPERSADGAILTNIVRDTFAGASYATVL